MLTPPSTSNAHMADLTTTLEWWQARHTAGCTIDSFCREEIARQWRMGEHPEVNASNRVEWANREYLRLYLLSMELANFFLLRIAEPPQMGVPTVFRPVAPWYQAKETTT